MSLAKGTRLGPYELQSLLGAGGMGEVYKALDTRLNRIDALKTLHAHLADNPEVRERFEREAQTIASLKHPHICVLHNIGQEKLPQGRIDYLVMEYLEGETLAARLEKGPLPIEQALQYAIEISDALDKAHRKGVTHRDIKPGNIMLVKEGSGYSTKLLDFGLAKLKQGASQQAPLPPLGPDDPTPPLGVKLRPPTAVGTIMGTYQYMSPEQAEGNNDTIDARTDIFSFGALLYEMVTGKKAFEGKSQASLIGAIMERDPPPMSSLVPVTPPALDRVVKKCLAKDRDFRWRSAQDLHDELQWIKEGGGQAGTVPAAELAAEKQAAERLAAEKAALERALETAVSRGRKQARVAWAVAIALAIIASVAAWILKPSPSHPAQVSRSVIPLPPGERISAPDNLPLALSPDGTQLAYIAASGQLYLRSLDSFEAKPVPGAENVHYSPFFSPDGQWLGFFAGSEIKKVSIHGGAPLVVTEVVGGPSTAVWGPHGTIILSPRTGQQGLWRVPDTGGAQERLTTPDPQKGESAHLWPQVLPDGSAVLFTVTGSSSSTASQIVAQSLKTGARRVLIQGGAYGRYVAPGYLVYMSEGTLMAAAFDAKRLEVAGTPIPVVEGVLHSDTGAGQFTVSANGTLVYVPGGVQQRGSAQKLVWVDRKGAVEPLAAPPRSYGQISLSPDGRQVAMSLPDGARSDIWVYDIARNSFTRLTFRGLNLFPIWTPDGRRVTYRSNQGGAPNLFWKSADGSGAEERLTRSEFDATTSSWSPDGQFMIFTEQHPRTSSDLWVLNLKDRKAQPFLQTPAAEGQARFSPNGRWLAYNSDESGRLEVYVLPFVNPGSAPPAGAGAQGSKWQISTEGGLEPMWSPNGKELFYRNGPKMMAVDVTTEPTFTAGSPRLLFQGSFAPPVTPLGSAKLSSDGQRFLMLQDAEQDQAPSQINVVLNWSEELKKKVPTGK